MGWGDGPEDIKPDATIAPDLAGALKAPRFSPAAAAPQILPCGRNVGAGARHLAVVRGQGLGWP